jgi:hypothetical protein|tara:strand:+ start:313 stop:1068 length:756 start_codon:yes stop_codon:yes gene_type:complete
MISKKIKYRYLSIRKDIEEMGEDDNDLAVLLLTASECNLLQATMEKLKVLQEITITLQNDDLTMDDARALLDLAIETFPSANCRIGKEAKIIKFPDFENGVVKILEKKESKLTVAEDAAVYMLLKPVTEADKDGNDDTDETEVISTAQAVLNKCKRMRSEEKVDETTGAYINPKFICPTSNIVERLFSRCKLTLTSLRTRLSPEHLESIIYLLYNRTYWNALTVSQAGVTDGAEIIPEDTEYPLMIDEVEN